MGKTYRSKAPTQKKVPTFTVEGNYIDVGDAGDVIETEEEWSETFRCLPTAPGAALDDLVSSVSINEEGDISFSKVSVLRFIRSVLTESEEQRFNAMVRDKRKLVDLDVIGQIMMDLAEEYTGRPIGPQRTSPGSLRDTDNGSPANSSSSDTEPTTSIDSTSPPSFT